MIKYITTLCICLWSLTAIGQASQRAQASTEEIQTAVQFLDWVEYLYEFGVRIDADTMLLSAEVQNLVNHDELRAFMYPEEYTWDRALALLNEMQIKRALWHFINLYPENKTVVTKALVKYDHLFEMDRALLGSFYTYAFVDPEISSIENGKPQIVHPDVLELKLETVTEMIQYLTYYRGLREDSENQ